MSAFEKWGLVLGALALLLNGGALYFGLRQLGFLREQIRQAQDASTMDHARRKAQATIDFYAGTIATRAQFRAKLPFDRDAAGVAELTTRARNDLQLTKELADYLGMWELFATAANTDVTDRDVVNLVGGGRIKAIVTNYGDWMDWRRQDSGVASLYCELTELARSLPAFDESRSRIKEAMRPKN